MTTVMLPAVADASTEIAVACTRLPILAEIRFVLVLPTPVLDYHILRRNMAAGVDAHISAPCGGVVEAADGGGAVVENDKANMASEVGGLVCGGGEDDTPYLVEGIRWVDRATNNHSLVCLEVDVEEEGE